MRISIWQQFSSNHSADFTVVGQFESEEYATQVADELRHILRTIGAWWEQYETWDERSRIEQHLIEQGELTPPEKEFAETYGVGWTQYKGGKIYPLDWVYSSDTAKIVRVYRNIVAISPTGNTWAGSKPFDAIMRVRGGVVAKEVEDEGDLTLTLSCTVPDENTGTGIYQTVYRESFKDGSPKLRFPNFGNAVPATIERNGLKITFRDIPLRWAGLGLEGLDILVHMVEFLEEHHCTHIEYQFNETPYS